MGWYECETPFRAAKDESRFPSALFGDDQAIQPTPSTGLGPVTTLHKLSTWRSKHRQVSRLVGSNTGDCRPLKGALVAKPARRMSSRAHEADMAVGNPQCTILNIDTQQSADNLLRADEHYGYRD